MKLITKIKKSKDKTKAFLEADLSRPEAEALVQQMIMSLPGHYKIHSREYGVNLIDKVWEVYGWMPSMLIDERMLLGMQIMNEKKVYASFTLGLDAIEIRK